MDKYLIICHEEWKDGVCVLPRIETTIVAHDIDDARQKAVEKYPQYQEISVFDWVY